MDFRIYVELADQYRIIGPASNVAKRNVLAEHLKEVIDTLEKKVRPPTISVSRRKLTNCFSLG